MFITFDSFDWANKNFIIRERLGRFGSNVFVRDCREKDFKNFGKTVGKLGKKEKREKN